MILLDANLLVYAYIPSLKEHIAAARWLEKLLSSGEESVGITWQVATAFLRISTNNRIFDSPLDIDVAKQYLDDVLAHPMTIIVQPTESHWDVYSKILTELDLAGDIVMDAHLAAIASEYGASVASTDKHFRRFSSYIKFLNPLQK